MHLRCARLTLLLFIAALTLAACHRDESGQVGGSTPEAAVQGSITLLKAGDIAGLWKHALPPADYATLRADWARRQHAQAPAGAAEKTRFDASLAQLNAPDAQDKLYATLAPRLSQLEHQYKDQLPVLVAMGGAFLKNGVARNPQLAAAQKQQADQLIDALTPWAQQAPWFDQAKAKQAVGIAVATARKLDLKSPDALRALDFDTAMAKYATGYTGLKQVLAIYGLPLDEALASAKVSPVSSQGDHAVVRIDYRLFDQPLSLESTLVEQDGRWYSAALVDAVRAAHAQPVPAAP